MKANELRIGNTIDKGTIVNMIESGVHVGHGKCYTYSEIEPIPLTEDWLLRFGFKKVGVNFEKNGILLWLHKGNNTFDFVLRDGADNKKLIVSPQKYVHSLQNLVFALTGEELTIKNP